MNHIVSTDHIDSCPAINKKLRFIGYSISNSLFYHNNKFLLLTFCNCLKGYLSNCEFAETLLKNKLKNLETVDGYNVSRSWIYDKELRRLILDSKLMSKFVHECNFVYSDNALKKYAIVSKISYVKRILEGDGNLEENYIEAKEYLIKTERDFLLNDLEDLYNINKCGEMPNTLYMAKTIQDMNKQFSKLIKNKKS